MVKVSLQAEIGRQKGSSASRRLRRAGKVPAVLYGLGQDTVAVSVRLHELRHALTRESGLNAIIALEVDDDEHLCIVKELQRHPVRSEVLHIDFERIDPDSEVEVTVPLVLTGEAKKVTQASGMVDQVMHHLQVRAGIDDIPVRITTDISQLEVGTSLRVADIDFPTGVTPVGDREALFAVGLITRSTKEYLRQLKAQEDTLDVFPSDGETVDTEEPDDDD